ncbi:potassium-transporting ATPase subunit KdpB [Actinomycetospora endophytica]|uniref:Potassium-transporting ATPase ATP-binding subunit n=1 Tax=Actinomycetospora endophytica TaxID=2291215 RepID=A0ABS8PAF7_9PSEU|nr:potassium-transporting ATPase subunit KdpB [Actinomycetospora endophytica]MCD2195241.1 potassium-transporting ATPase subunit KdpB [Actinomycetospora endophytica]
MRPVDRPPREAQEVHAERSGRVGAGAFRPAQLLESLPEALRKLDPRVQIRNPVMFVVWVGSVVVTVSAVVSPSVFAWLIAVWLWFTVVFANLAEAVAEGRGRAQADALRRTRTDTVARRLRPGGTVEEVPATALRLDDRVVVEAGQTIPGDGEIVDGIATVDESAITGESAPVVRESGGDFSSVTGGTTVLSDRIVVRITTRPGESFVDRMIALVEGAQRQKTPNEIALTILLAALTIVFLLAVVTLQPMAGYSGAQQSLVVLVALLVCLIPTTIGALLSAIGIAGMDRLVQRNVLATSGRAVEAAGDVSTLLLDKTGTITYGNRRATALHALPGVGEAELARLARLSSLADSTPEGRSIVELCASGFGLAPEASAEEARAEFVPFSATTRMSGVDVTGPDGSVESIRKGAVASVLDWLDACGSGDDRARAHIEAVAQEISSRGGTPLACGHVNGFGRQDDQFHSHGGAIELSDVVKPGIAARFAELRTMGIRTVMITGDNPVTARAIAAESGVDDVLAEATPEDKLALIRQEQSGGRLVAMTGDGTNDAPALAQADVGVAMNSGTTAAKEAGNMVDLDSDPTKLIGVVEIGKQMLVTRGALTTFSVANDLAKYFAILPAMFLVIFPQLAALNVMHLATPESAILSAVIFNALIIVALIPLALRGVRFRPMGSDAMLRRNLLVYGLGGVVVPFVGIYLIDLVVRFIPGIG